MNTTLVMGPVLFNWTPEDWRDFHFRMADEADVDVVCVGEVVCSKRAPFFEPYMADVIERLLAADKQVILSTLALIMNKREMKSVRDTAAIDEDNIIVEANDVSAVALLGGRPHAVGPFVNVYNEGTLAYLARNGARSVCLPVELGMDALGALAKDSPAELEVMVFGRLPLAISARCYHARAHGLHKDGCQYVC
ncbi:MAG: U32 family peptidase, partial [Rhodospirillaceae bacterium]|nr:U32 family peptidase [Rhodospirillaceae bacterium]